MILENYAALLTASIALVTSIVTLVFNWYSNRKKDYINLITQERLNYIILLRQHFVDFATKVECIPGDYISPYVKSEILRHKYEIFMKLNPKYKKWDKDIMGKIEQILIEKSKVERDKQLKDMVMHAQFLFKLEWEGLNEEAKKGHLNQLDKYLLREKMYAEYEKAK